MEVPKTLDWVAERAKCSLAALFLALAELIDSDVKSVNSLGRADARFSFEQPARGKLVVLRERNLGGLHDVDSVVLELTRSAITVTAKDSRGGGNALFSAVPSFNQQGECLLRVGHDDLRLWQVSRRALEDLFFGD